MWWWLPPLSGVCHNEWHVEELGNVCMCVLVQVCVCMPVYLYLMWLRCCACHLDAMVEEWCGDSLDWEDHNDHAPWINFLTVHTCRLLLLACGVGATDNQNSYRHSPHPHTLLPVAAHCDYLNCEGSTSHI